MSDDRITRLEESHAFLERTVEALDGEMRTLGERVDELRRLVARLEARMGAMQEGVEEDADE